MNRKSTLLTLFSCMVFAKLLEFAFIHGGSYQTVISKVIIIKTRAGGIEDGGDGGRSPLDFLRDQSRIDWLYQEGNHSTVPWRYLAARSGKLVESEEGCFTVPHPWQIDMANQRWQKLDDVFLYGAYFDGREEGQAWIRVSAIFEKLGGISQRHSCILWFNNGAPPAESPVEEKAPLLGDAFSRSPDRARLLGCPVPNGPAPVAVSVVKRVGFASMHDCRRPTNIIRVTNSKADHHHVRGSLGVCTRGLLRLDSSFDPRVVEWVEMSRILGAAKIYLYYHHLHASTIKILNYYANQGLVEVTKWIRHDGELLLDEDGINGTLASYNNLLNDRIIFNDCRAISKNDYLVNLDLDEMILPNSLVTWQYLVESMESSSNGRGFASFRFRNFYFPGEVENDEGYDQHSQHLMSLNFLSHTARTEEGTDNLYKSIYRASMAKTVFSHGPTSCVANRPCAVRRADPGREAILAHYRSDCQQGASQNCSESFGKLTEDRRALMFADELITKVIRAYTELEE